MNLSIRSGGTHQECDERREGAADARTHGRDAKSRCPHHGGEQLGRVIVDDGKGTRDEELARHDDSGGDGTTNRSAWKRRLTH